ncbi:unnamed protein product [Moneuplotes crassus]|uniref:Uncharacterized protein n=1 Tax=Euplotes crassus TaxID=5936 RepID=A0AAD1UGP3_EUPCR|nr:unnamed protein product [Moneuplotes crassus]
MSQIGAVLDICKFSGPDHSQMEVDKDLESLFESVQQDVEELQPLGIISFISDSRDQNCVLIRNLFEEVMFDIEPSESAVQIFTSPVDVEDSNGVNIKAFIISCVVNDEESDLNNTIIAFLTMISSYMVLNFRENTTQSLKQQLVNISDLVFSLQENAGFESEQGLVETLPNLLVINQDENQANSWDTFQTSVQALLAPEGSEKIDHLELIAEKDILHCSDLDSITPFSEDVQNIRTKLCSSTRPIRLGGYCVNWRMLFVEIEIICQALNSSSIPNFHDMFLDLINKEVNANIEEAKHVFQIEFSDNLIEGMEETQIDKLYQTTAGMVMKHFRANLDPYLNVGEEIDQLFNDFMGTYNQAKANARKFQDNLDYSQSCDGSQTFESLSEEQKGESKPEEDEFNVNLLNSELDQPGVRTNRSDQRSSSMNIEKSFHSSSNFDVFATVEKLKQELADKDTKMKELELKALTSPRALPSISSPLLSPGNKETKILRQKITELENDLNKKVELFRGEIKYWEDKASNEKISVSQIKDELHREKENTQRLLQEKERKHKTYRIETQNKLDEAREKCSDLEYQLVRKTREVEKEVILRSNNEKESTEQLKKKNELILELEDNNRKIKAQLEIYKTSSLDKLSQDQAKNELSDRVLELESELKKCKRESEQKLSNVSKERALIEQKVKFLVQEKEEALNKLKNRNISEEKIINMIENRYKNEQEEIKKEFTEAMEAKNKEIEQIRENFDELKEHLEEEVHKNHTNSEEVVQEYTSRVEQYEKEIESKELKLRELTNQLSSTKTALEQENAKIRKDSESMIQALQSKLHQLEAELANVGKMRKTDAFRQNNETEEKIKQIKDVYENEKKKFQNTLKSIRKENEDEIKSIQEEYEDKISQSSAQHEEEIGFLQRQNHQIRDEWKKAVEQLESQLKASSSEKKKLQEKVDELVKESTKKEKEITTLECQNQSLESHIRERDEIIEIYNQNQAEQEESLEQKREQEVQLRDLSTQKDLLEEKVKDLEQNLFEITEENQERVNDLKTKVKNLKLQMIRDNKRDRDTENRHNFGYISPEDKIGDFIFIRIRSIKTITPLSANTERNEILRKFMEYDSYEIEVVDDSNESQYEIHRTAHEILGLFKRLKQSFEGSTKLSTDYKFPDNLKEVLFDKKYCQNDMRKVSLQHYINDVCKQDPFKKSQELAAFLEIARFKTSKQYEDVLREVTNLELDSESDLD